MSISTADLSDEEIEEKKADAQEILDTMKEDPEADFDETASAVNEDYSALTGTFDANVPETEETDGEEMTSTSAYPEEVMEVLRTLDDGEMGPDVIETDTAFYVVRLDLKNDEHETEHKIEDIISEREEELYTDTTQQWMDEAEITVDEEVLKTLKLTDSHKFSIDTSASEETAEDTAPDDSTAAEETDSDAAAETDSAAADSGDTLSEDEILVPVEEDVPSTEEADTEESADTEAADAEEADDSAETDETAEEDTAAGDTAETTEE